jgi:dolichol-phosphate mannosyltransferase
MSKPRISVVIPAKDEEGCVGEVIRECQKYADEVIVVDGHSKDRTREISAQCGARVVSDHGIGKGDAIRVGIREASGDIIVFIDADGSHAPSDIPRLCAPIVKGEADHVTGSRMRGGSDELHGDIPQFIRMMGSDIITLSINYRFHVRLTDSQNGFRAIRAEVARRLDTREKITSIEQEMIIRTLRLGFRMAEVPAHEYARKAGVSKVRVWRVAPRYVYALIKNLLWG